MLKSCKYCGRIHPLSYACERKPVPAKKNTDAQHLRSSRLWTKKSIGIRQRDRYLCQACLHLYRGTERQYEYTGIEVHHITPLEEDISKAFEDEELVSLCRVHHEMAEADEIPRELLRKWAKESEAHFSGEERIVKKEAKV